jgi:hypothetical protein
MADEAGVWTRLRAAGKVLKDGPPPSRPPRPQPPRPQPPRPDPPSSKSLLQTGRVAFSVEEATCLLLAVRFHLKELERKDHELQTLLDAKEAELRKRLPDNNELMKDLGLERLSLGELLPHDLEAEELYRLVDFESHEAVQLRDRIQVLQSRARNLKQKLEQALR